MGYIGKLFIWIASVFTEFSRADPFLFPHLFWLTKHSPSLRKASRWNPGPTFSNCMQSDVMSVPFSLMTFSKKIIVYHYWLIERIVFRCLIPRLQMFQIVIQILDIGTKAYTHILNEGFFLGTFKTDHQLWLLFYILTSFLHTYGIIMIVWGLIPLHCCWQLGRKNV